MCESIRIFMCGRGIVQVQEHLSAIGHQRR